MDMTPAKLISDGLAARIEVSVSTIAKFALDRIGRTEDVRFSPDNSKLAIASFLNQACVIFDIEIDRSNSTPVIRLNDFVELRSSGLNYPHGLDFIDEKTLVVSNRQGWVSIFEIPEPRTSERTYTIEPICMVKKAGMRRKIASPGSVCVVSADKGRVELLVCNNYKHRVSRHVVYLGSGFGIPRNKILLETGLVLPDGIAISRDKTWIAVSNHDAHNVAIYNTGRKLNRKSAPAGLLKDLNCPHGLRFSPDGRHIYVAEAGAPYVSRFEAHDGDWSGTRGPVQTITVLDDETYAKGRTNPQEGGPKGIDIDVRAEVMAVTNQEQALAFFHIPTVFG